MFVYGRAGLPSYSRHWWHCITGQLMTRGLWTIYDFVQRRGCADQADVSSHCCLRGTPYTMHYVHSFIVLVDWHLFHHVNILILFGSDADHKPPRNRTAKTIMVCVWWCLGDVFFVLSPCVGKDCVLMGQSDEFAKGATSSFDAKLCQNRAGMSSTRILTLARQLARCEVSTLLIGEKRAFLGPCYCRRLTRLFWCV